MVREPHPAGIYDGTVEDELPGGAPADDPNTRDSEALPDKAGTPPQTPVSGGSLPDPTGVTAAHSTYGPPGNDEFGYHRTM